MGNVCLGSLNLDDDLVRQGKHHAANLLARRLLEESKLGAR